MPAAKYDNTDGRLRGRSLQARRLRVWTANPCCAMCGELTDIAAEAARPFQLDHNVPLFKGGKDIDENCQVLCSAKGKSCHDKKTALDMGHRVKQQIGPDGWPV